MKLLTFSKTWILALPLIATVAQSGNEGSQGTAGYIEQAKPLPKPKVVLKELQLLKTKILATQLPKPFTYAIADEIDKMSAQSKDKFFYINAKIMLIGKDYQNPSTKKIVTVDAFTDTERYSPIYISVTAFKNKKLQKVLMHELTHHVLPGDRSAARNEEANDDEPLIEAIAELVVNGKTNDIPAEQILRDLFVLNETALINRMVWPFLLTEVKKLKPSQIWKLNTFASDNAQKLYYQSFWKELGNSYTQSRSSEEIKADADEAIRSRREEILYHQPRPMTLPIERGTKSSNYNSEIEEWMPYHRDNSILDAPSSYSFGRWDSFGNSLADEAQKEVEAKSLTVEGLEKFLDRGLPVNSSLTEVIAANMRWDLLQRLLDEKDFNPNQHFYHFMPSCTYSARFGPFQAKIQSLAHCLVQGGDEETAIKFFQHPRFIRNSIHLGHTLLSLAIRSDRQKIFDTLRADPKVRWHLAGRGQRNTVFNNAEVNTTLSEALLQENSLYLETLLKDLAEESEEFETARSRAIYILGSFVAATDQLKLKKLMDHNKIETPWKRVTAATLIERSRTVVVEALDEICKEGPADVETLLEEASYSLFEMPHDYEDELFVRLHFKCGSIPEHVKIKPRP
jgi:hypothetical protein